jgi:RNA recognition motif-containing protein
MKGLPYSVTNDDITSFFHQFRMVEDSIKIAKYPDGKITGEAAVNFESPEDARNALKQKQKDYIGKRFIELFAISNEEYADFATNVQSGGGFYGGGRGGSRGGSYRGRGGRGGSNYGGNSDNQPQQYMDTPADDDNYYGRRGGNSNYRGGAPRQQHFHDKPSYSQQDNDYDGGKKFVKLSDYITPENRNSCVKIRGLPFSTCPQEVRDFFSDFRISERDVILDKSHGQLTGYALVILENADEAARACKQLDKQYVGSRYVDVFFPDARK